MSPREQRLLWQRAIRLIVRDKKPINHLQDKKLEQAE